MNNGFENWYPICAIEKLVAGGIYPFRLLNEPLILFRNAMGQAVCLQDRCPHRSTPLSLGRLVNGVVECRYHGWQFDGTGQCVRIPALAKESAFPKRSCAVAKLVVEEYGLIWVYHGNQQSTQSLSANYDQHFSGYIGKNCTRFDYSMDIAIPHELMIENLLDPAHLPFAHHGTLSKREKAAPIKFTIHHEQDKICGISETASSPRNKQQRFYFDPPCTVYFDISFKGRGIRQVHYCLPLTPETMRLNSVFFYQNMPWMKWMPFIKAFHNRMSRKIVKQDIAMLKGQYQNIQQGAKPWHQAIAADQLALHYRNWLNDQLQLASPWVELL